MEMKWLAPFGVIYSVEFVLYGMQRASLLISRNAGFQWRGGGELLLPGWYPITWLFILGKWGLLLAMAILWNWKVALGLAVASFIGSVVIPIPYGLYKGVFQRRVDQLMFLDPMVATQLREMLDKASF